MPRGTKLNSGTTSLLSMIKTEIGYALQSGVATAQDTELKQLCFNMQQWLWGNFRWPFLYTHEDVATATGTRYYSNPVVVSYDYPTTVETKWGDIWYPVDYGIGGDEYTVSDPDRNQTLDPIRKWQQANVTNPGMFEVWPVPSSNQTLRFWGTSVCAALSADTDVCTLDDLLIVLFVAAEKLKRLKQTDWQEKMARANAHFNRLKAANNPRSVFTFGGDDALTYQKPVRTVAVASNSNQH